MARKNEVPIDVIGETTEKAIGPIQGFRRRKMDDGSELLAIETSDGKVPDDETMKATASYVRAKLRSQGIEVDVQPVEFNKREDPAVYKKKGFRILGRG